MKKSLQGILIVLSLFAFIGCSSKHAPLETVQKVNLERYLGTWYEIARYEHAFQKDCKNVTATYSMNEDQTIHVLNQCQTIQTNEQKSATAKAYAADDSNSKLKVTFFWPFYGDYWILMLADDYEYAVVGTPSREYLWILSRTKTLHNDTKRKILKQLAILQFDTSKLLWTIQE